MMEPSLANDKNKMFISWKRQLARELSVYLHSHETEVYRSPKGYQMIKIKRCADCDMMAIRKRTA